MWDEVDALLLPVPPGHPSLADVAADPVGVNSRLGRLTTFASLLDLCAVAVPAGRRDDDLPFGVPLVAPTFADEPLLNLAARWCGEPARFTATRTRAWSAFRAAEDGSHLGQTDAVP